MTQIVAHPCRIPLRGPRVSDGSPCRYRDTVLLSDDQGRWSEAAPLPGFSREELADLLALFPNRRADSLELARAGTHLPSLAFALDGLADAEWPLAQVPVNALLSSRLDGAELDQAARRLARSACRAVKMKIGSGFFSIEQEVQRTIRLRERLRPDQDMRLDANRAWDWEQAVAFAHGVDVLGEDAIAYIEEPLADIGRLEEFTRVTKCRYALDETLAEDVTRARVVHGDFPSSAALVIKPTLLGRHDQWRGLTALGKPLVMSGCFETGIGTLHIARWAARLSPDIPVGLDTCSRLADDVLVKRLEIAHPDQDTWVVPLTGPPRVDLRKIKELSV